MAHPRQLLPLSAVPPGVPASIVDDRPQAQHRRLDRELLYSFGTGTDGAAPVGRVVFDSSGNLYGTTSTAGDGTVFQLQPGTSWHEKILHSVLNADDGNTPYAGLVADPSGNFYGVATAGGVNGGGTIFELTLPLP